MIHVLQNPLQFIIVFSQNFLRKRSFVYFISIFLPFFILGRRSLIWFFPVLCIVLLYMLSAVDGQTSGSNHYEFIFLPFLWMATALGFLRAQQAESPERLKSQLIWSICLALCLFGRSPVFEATDHLFHRGNVMRASYEMSFWKISDPVAASALTLSHFSNHAHLRYLRTPETPVPADRTQALQSLVNLNPPTAPTDLLQDISDTKTFILDREIPWEKWLEEELVNHQQGLVTNEARLFDGEKRFSSVEIPGTFLNDLCIKEKICLALKP